MLYALIPIRYADLLSKDNKETIVFDGKPLWLHTLEYAASQDIFTKIIIAYDNADFYNSNKKYLEYYSNIVLLERPSFLSCKGVSTIEVLKFVSEKVKLSNKDYWVMLEASHPVRYNNMIHDFNDIVESRALDLLIPVSHIKYNIWVRQNNMNEITRLASEDDKNHVSAYKELIGVGAFFRNDILSLSDIYMAENIELVSIEDMFANIDIRNSNSYFSMDYEH